MKLKKIKLSKGSNDICICEIVLQMEYKIQTDNILIGSSCQKNGSTELISQKEEKY